MITTTVKVPARKILQFQELIRQYNYRFAGFTQRQYHRVKATVEKNGQILVDDDYYVVTVYCFGDIHKFNEFEADWARLNRPITEKIRKLPLHRRIIKFIFRK